ncbi:subtilisin-like protein [Lactarius psammicola]|nr:subtilisin-like protein [Lactarius psammicola]
MRCRLLSVLSVLAAGTLHSLAIPLAAHWGNMRMKHAWNAVPANWEGLGCPPAGTTIDLRIALKPHSENALINALYQVSEPGNQRHNLFATPLLGAPVLIYGKHLSKEQVAELVAPHPDTLELINSWLEHHAVSSSSISMTHGGSWLTVSGVPVSQANELLGASYQLYRHTQVNETILRTVRYALPATLHAHVQTVAPTTHFASARMLQQMPRSHSGGAAVSPSEAAPGEPINVLSRRDEFNYLVTPGFLRWLYKTTDYVPVATAQNALGVVGYHEQYPSPSDLTTFMQKYRTEGQTQGGDATFTVEKVNGGEYDPNNPGVEANLDIQYTQAMAFPIRHIYYSTGGAPPFIPSNNVPTNTNEPFLDWLGYVLSLATIPPTITMSYGSEEQTVPQDYATNVCHLFARLGARGVSVIFSSGDVGVGGGDCIANDGSGKVRFQPNFPASCPFVTSVGGTNGFNRERRTDSSGAGFSSGGFSNYFPRESYQDGAVTTFLQHLGDKYVGLYNPAGRGYPDIAVQALNFDFARGGVFMHVSGTSCAAPTAAGVFSLLNDYLIMIGKSPLGFLNPWLYGHLLAGLTDITSGSNPGCKTEGFPAVPGWDPVTGLGSPNFKSLQEILRKLHAPNTAN